MPLFEFRCPSCGRVEERYVAVACAMPMPVCLCSTALMGRMPSAPALISIRGYSQFNGYSRNKETVVVPGHERMKVTVEPK